MKILQLVQARQRRGAEVFAFELSRALEALQCEVRTVYLYAYDGDQRLPMMRDDVCLEASAGAATERLPGLQPRLLWRVMAEIQRFQPDIVQVNGSRTVKYGAVARHMRFRSAKWLLVYRNIDMPSFWNRRRGTIAAYRGVLMPAIDGVVGVSQASLKDVQRLYRVSAPSVTIPNSVDARKLRDVRDRHWQRRSEGVDDDQLLLVFVGSLVKQKRPDRFLRVVRRVSEAISNVQAWLIGDGPLRPSLEESAQRSGLAGRCRFWGYRDDVASLLNAGDVLIVSSDTEGIPAVILEASYLGIPTIATRVGAIDECVVSGETGVLVEAPFTERLAEATIALASDAAMRSRMGAMAMQRAKAQFGIDRAAGEYRRFYELLASQTNAAQRSHVDA